MNPTAHQASHDECLLAAVAHSAALLPFLGFIVPLHIWITQRDWSRFVCFHALQALIYQLVMPSVTLTVYLLGIWGLYGTILGAVPTGLNRLGEGLPPGLLSLRCLFVVLVIAGWIFTIVLGLLAANRILAGRDFLYPILGQWVAKHFEGGDSSA